MTKKFIFKNNNYLLDVDYDDEIETVCWLDTNNKKYYNCGCCDDCECDDKLACKNCGCNCNCDEIEEDYDIEDDLEEESDDDFEESDNDFEEETNNKQQNNLDISKLSNFNINIIEDKEKDKKVRITLKINVSLNNKKEIINIDFDINKSTYLKIAEELFN